MTSWKTPGLCVSALLVMAVGQASATIVTFDDLAGSATLADGYGGITWGVNWSYYDTPQYPYTPASGSTRIYHTFGSVENPFTFSNPVVFDGGAFSGQSWESVRFDLYLAGSLVATSATIVPSGTPYFLSSGFSGLVDEVRVVATSGGYFTLDDVTYTSAAVPEPSVPEPSSVALMALGVCFTVVRIARRRRCGQ